MIPIFVSVAQEPNSGPDRLIFEVFRSHTPGMTPLNEWSTCRSGRYIHNT